jgi:hypothetical protein
MLYPLSYGGELAQLVRLALHSTVSHPRLGARAEASRLPTVASSSPKSPYGPSPPDAVHERGSHGLSPSSGLLGAANSPLVAFVVVVVVGGTVVVVVVVVLFDPFLPFEPFGVVVVVVGAAGGFTEKFVPVSTVTSAPPSTMEGL